MFKSNRSPAMRIFCAVLCATLFLTCFGVAGAMAKYTSQATGTDTATVAKWSFTVEDADIATANTFTMDLFAMPDNNNVEQTNGLIAPGTNGSIELNFTNGSQVNATYDLTLAAEISDPTLPIQFKLDNGEWTDDISSLKVTDEAIEMNGKTAAHTLFWQWVFEQDNIATGDPIDTDLGIDAAAGNAATCVVTATVVAEQVD